LSERSSRATEDPEDDAVVPHSGFYENEHICKLRGKNQHRKYASFRQRFSVWKYTIYEDSHIPLPCLFFAIYLADAYKKGILLHQVAHNIKATQKNWHGFYYALYGQRFHPKNTSQPIPFFLI
jgi:hypothetical protein